jgi:UDP-glucose 4-epimerase
MLVASSEEITNKLGWQPRYPQLADIIRTAWDWHQRNPLGYKQD